MIKQNSKKQYSEKYFQKPFPPNHNPLIGAMRYDTLCNVRDAIYTIQDLTNPPEGINLSTKSSTGMYFILNCVIGALQFEIWHRK